MLKIKTYQQVWKGYYTVYWHHQLSSYKSIVRSGNKRRRNRYETIFRWFQKMQMATCFAYSQSTPRGTIVFNLLK